METVLGLRAEPTAIHYTVAKYSEQGVEFVTAGSVKKPAAFTESQGLGHIRTQLISIYNEYHVNRVAIKAAEGKARLTAALIPRFRIEGVVMELASSIEVPASTEVIATIASALKFKSSKYKEAKEGSFDPLDLIDDWDSLSVPSREALLASIAAAKRG